MAYVKLEDEKGRITHVPVLNESEDGSGTWHVPVCDTSGYLKVSLQSVLDDVLWKLGTDGDIVLLNRSTILAADTALAGVLIGTPDTPALAANSLIISNVTEDGDILIAVNDGGHSKQMLFLVGSTGITHIGKPGSPSVSATGDTFFGGSVEFGAGRFIYNDPAGMFVAKEDIGFAFGATGNRLGLVNGDTNARIIVFRLPNATNYPPVLAIGTQGIWTANLGWFDGLVTGDATLALVNESEDAYVSLDCGDINAGVTGKGLYFKAAADEDINILKLSVTGTPTIIWDESEDEFYFNQRVNALSYAAGGTDGIDESGSGTIASFTITIVKGIVTAFSKVS